MKKIGRLLPLLLAGAALALLVGVSTTLAGPSLGFTLPPWLQYYHHNVTNPATPDLPAATVQALWAAAAAETANGARHGRLISMNNAGPSTENRSTANPVNGIHTLYFDAAAGGGVLAVTTYVTSGPQSIGYDILFIDGDVTWRNGLNIDLQTVALHELGHAIGLAHNPVPGTVMYAAYGGVIRQWTPSDVVCIQNLGYPPISCSLTGVSPPRVPASGGTALTITGSGFVAGIPITVTVGGVNAGNVAVVNSTTITCTAPPLAPGTYPVVVSFSGGPTCSRANAVSTYQVPTITATSIVTPNTTLSVQVTHPGGGTTTSAYVAVGLVPSAGIPIPGMDGLLLLADPFLLFSGSLDPSGQVTFNLPVPAFTGFFFVYWQALVLPPATFPVFSNRVASLFVG